MRDDRRVRVALARWQVIAEATDERLGPAERGRVVCELAAGCTATPTAARGG